MMEKMIALQQKRRSKKGGFTLVELIVVLVILAILAALLIPALTGYINKAKEKKVIAETRMAVMAVQTMNSDYAAKNADIDWTKLTDTQKDEFKELAEIDADTVSNVKFDDKHAVSTLTYTSDKKTCTYAKNQYTCSTLTTGK